MTSMVTGLRRTSETRVENVCQTYRGKNFVRTRGRPINHRYPRVNS
jgi:hypothetical protein